MRILPLVAAAAFTAHARADAQVQQSEPFEWSAPASRGMTLRVGNMRGDVSVVPARGNRVEVRAIKLWRRGDPTAVAIVARASSGTIDVCTTASTGSCDNPSRSTRAGDVVVQYSIAIPAGMRLAVTTLNGNIAISADVRDVEAQSINGDVVVQSLSGRVLAATVNGSVTTWLGDDVNASVEIQALSLHSDFAIVSTAPIRRGVLSGDIGTGGRKLELRALRGAVWLRRGMR